MRVTYLISDQGVWPGPQDPPETSTDYQPTSYAPKPVQGNENPPIKHGG